MDPYSEHVYFVADFYDGILSGVADFGGTPHWFQCAEEKFWDVDERTYRLTPMDENWLALEVEQHSIWQRWEAQHNAGDVLIGAHPGDANARYIEIEHLLKAKRDDMAASIIIACGTFENTTPLTVRWNFISEHYSEVEKVITP